MLNFCANDKAWSFCYSNQSPVAFRLLMWNGVKFSIQSLTLFDMSIHKTYFHLIQRVLRHLYCRLRHLEHASPVPWAWHEHVEKGSTLHRMIHHLLQNEFRFFSTQYRVILQLIKDFCDVLRGRWLRKGTSFLHQSS